MLMNNYYELGKEELFKKLGVTDSGLSNEKAKKRQYFYFIGYITSI